MTAPPCILLANGAAGATVLDHATASGWPVERLVLNEPSRQREAVRLRNRAEDRGIPVTVWSPDAVSTLVRHAASPSAPWLLSVFFGHILPSTVLDAYDGRAANVHPSFLPWGRGKHPNVWSILEGTPAGASLHVMTEEVDRGPILAQRTVDSHLGDTGASLYSKLERACADLVIEAWPGIADLLPGAPQPDGGSYHEAAEFATLAEYDLSASHEAAALFHRLRALTFPPYDALRVRLGSEVVEARVVLTLIEPGVRSDGAPIGDDP